MYNLDYYEKMLREYSATAEQICRIRWEFIGDFLGIGGKGKGHTILDYGSGVGWFRAWKPRGKNVKVYSFDIANYPQTGLELQIFDCTCFWDVLEHIPDFKVIEPILALSKHVAVSLPIAPNDLGNLKDWKHFKPGEHLHYFTNESLEALFAQYGFYLLVEKDVECPPRKDIKSFIFRRET